MKRFVLIGCENTKRTEYFMKAAKELDVYVGFENIFECVPEQLQDAVVKLDPYVYQTSELGKMEETLDKYSALLKRYAENDSLGFLNHPYGILEVLDKIKCKEKLMNNNISTTEMIGCNIKNIDSLKQLMLSKKEYAVFIKPVRSSGAAGIVAYRFNPITSKESLYTCAYMEDNQLINTKKLYHLEDKVKIEGLLGKILSMENMIERWYSKADYNGKKYDLRVVWQFGKIDFAVARQSKGPITNLHLNNQALDIKELGLSKEKWMEIEQLCDCAMKLFPSLNSAGIDIMLEKGSLKPRIIEINGQGDLIYQDIFAENIIYKNQILSICQDIRI